MTDIFSTGDVNKLLYKKHIVFIGDSNVRGFYKDLLWLICSNTIVPNDVLRRKLEVSCLGDRLVAGDRLCRGRDYVEVREFKRMAMKMEFHFVTRCYTPAVERMMRDIKMKRKPAPDVIVMNSCVWDITRWGPNGVLEYKDNLVKLMKLLKDCLPEETLMIWATTTPMSSICKGGFLVQQVEFMQHSLRFEVMEANTFARQVVVAHGFDILDIHFHLIMQIHRRAKDGIHWQPLAIRHMTNLILTHIALSWDRPLPANFKSKALDRIKATLETSTTEHVKPTVPALPEVLQEEPTKTEATKPQRPPKIKLKRMRKFVEPRPKTPAYDAMYPEKAYDVMHQEEAYDVRYKAKPYHVRYREEAYDVMRQEEAYDVMRREEAYDVMHQEEACDVMRREEAYDVMHRQEAYDVMQREEAYDVMRQEEASDVMRREEAYDVMHQEEAYDVMRREEAYDVMHRQEAYDVMHREEAYDVMHRGEAYDVVHRENYNAISLPDFQVTLHFGEDWDSPVRRPQRNRSVQRSTKKRRNRRRRVPYYYPKMC